MRLHYSPTYRVSVPSGTSRAKSEFFFRICFDASCEMAVAGRTGPNAVGIMPKVHDMWVNSLAALLGALAAIRSAISHQSQFFMLFALCRKTGLLKILVVKKWVAPYVTTA